MRVIYMTNEQHKRLLALVRRQALFTQDMDWDEALSLLELDRPEREPVASRRAPAPGVRDFVDAAERRRAS